MATTQNTASVSTITSYTGISCSFNGTEMSVQFNMVCVKQLHSICSRLSHGVAAAGVVNIASGFLDITDSILIMWHKVFDI